MNRTPETVHQTNVTGERAEIERGLRLAKKYWLETIQSHVKGRILRGVEFFVAQHAHWHLQKAVEKAGDWNRLCADKKDGAHLPVSVDVPEMLFADNVKPEILAAIAAPLVKKNAKLTPVEAIRNAHELLMAAERYIGTLPKKTEGTESFIADFDTALARSHSRRLKRATKKLPGNCHCCHLLHQKGKADPNKKSASSHCQCQRSGQPLSISWMSARPA
jgi:hypothetical protein